MSVVQITKGNFHEEVTESTIPVLLDFSASWCGPCKMLNPIIDEIGKELDGKVKVCKVDIEAEKELATAFKVMSIPALMLVKDKQIIRLGEGFKSKREIMRMIQ